MQEGLSWNEKGELIHVINGELRATVQQAHAADYVAALKLQVPSLDLPVETPAEIAAAAAAP